MLNPCHQRGKLLIFTWFSFSRLLLESASDCRKTNQGWGCVEKVVKTKLNIQYIKNLQQLKEIAVFIIYIIVVPANCDN